MVSCVRVHIRSQIVLLEPDLDKLFSNRIAQNEHNQINSCLPFESLSQVSFFGAAHFKRKFPPSLLFLFNFGCKEQKVRSEVDKLETRGLVAASAN